MAEQIIIALSDIQEFWPISDNIDEDKINASILRAQQIDLERVLGPPLYHAFIEDYNGTSFDTAIYQTLFDGTNYAYNGQDIYFRGVRHLLSVYAYVRIIESHKINVVRAGVTVKVVEESETAEDFQVRAVKRRALDDAIRLEKDLLQYLHTNRTSYPLFKYRVVETEKTAYNFNKVI
jgi:hypothetical protein